VAISQGCYVTTGNHERAVLRQLIGELDLEGVLIQADALQTKRPFFGSSRGRAYFLLTVKGNQKTLHRRISSQFQGKRKIPFVATDHEVGHGREVTWMLRARQAPEHISEAWIGTSWIVEGMASGTRYSKHFRATHLFLTSLRTSPKALLRLVRDRWSIEGSHWIRDTQPHEDAHRYRGNGAGVMATLHTAALKLLRLTGFQWPRPLEWCKSRGL